MSRAILHVVLALALVAAPLAAEAQPARKVGFLAIGTPQLPYFIAFREGLRELGYAEGQNAVVVARFSEGAAGLAELATELVRLKVDVMVVVGGAAAEAARRATKTIPIVAGVSPDPVEAGFVSSLARPGGNLTGISFMSAGLAGKRLELLSEILPRVTRVAVLSNPVHPGERLDWGQLKAAAEQIGLTLQYLVVRGPADFDAAFAAMTKERAEALVAIPDTVTLANRQRIADFALAAKLPTMAAWREFTDAGCLLSFGPSLRNELKRLALYVDRVLKGAKPADLPVEQPTRFELVINMKTAKALGLTIPQSVLVRADEVIQ